jgi:hypothetical protein
MNIQPRTRQKKHKISTRAITEIQNAVERDSIRWKCSKSWIIATALAAFYGIDIALPFEVKKNKKAA